ncbi:MAG: hypothetical protein R2731_06160 [Nocardioides sp.]
MSDRFHRPATPGDRFFEAITGDDDPARLSEAADRAATLLVRGAHDSADSGVAERVVRLAETEGLETLAELWAGASPESLAGCLWRLYVLRAWVYADPERAAHEFEAGRLSAPVARVVAGVADPPGPDELKSMVDEVLRVGSPTATSPTCCSGRPRSPAWSPRGARGSPGPPTRRPRGCSCSPSSSSEQVTRNSRTGWPDPLHSASEYAGPRQPRVPTSAAASGHAP